jgi:hypothetical protein
LFRLSKDNDKPMNSWGDRIGVFGTFETVPEAVDFAPNKSTRQPCFNFFLGGGIGGPIEDVLAEGGALV